MLVILFAVLSNAPLPLYYEVSAEITYPVSEAVSGGIMTAGMSGGYSLVLLVFSYAGVGWMTVIALACACGGLLCLAFVQIRMKREELENKSGDVNVDGDV